MRYIVFMLFILPFAAFAQDCTLKKGSDDFSGKAKVSTGFFMIQNGMLNIEATATETDYFFVVKNENANCFDDESIAVFVFEGGKTKATYKNNGASNCQGVYHTIFKTGNITSSAIQKLTTKKLVSITFTANNEKTTVIEFTPEQQQKIFDLSNCISKEAKALPR